MKENYIKELINVVKEDSKKALGCTEPVAVAYGANLAGSYISKDKLDYLKIQVSKNIFKNGKFVKIPNTGDYGLDLAGALGILTSKAKEPFLVFSSLTDQEKADAYKLINQGKIKLSYLDRTDIYISIEAKAGSDLVNLIISKSHGHVEKIILNDEIVYKDLDTDTHVRGFSIKDLSFSKLGQIVDEMSFEDLSFTLEGIDVNLQAARLGLEGYGSKLGKTLAKLRDQGILADNFISDTRIATAAAADMRMGGGDCPIVTSGGSGNQGIGVILPVYMVGKHESITEERLARALFFAHSINRYVKEYAGKLSGICGCAIGAAIGASSAIVYMLGGDETQMAGACTNIYANLTGMICDGAKESCSMKLSTSAEESVIAAYLALNGVISEAGVGIIGENIEQTISNIGKLSHKGFANVDDIVLEIMGS